MSVDSKRDLASDVFRGLGLCILFIDHLEPNFWSHFTPAQFGFSDFAEIFVFFSGYINAGMYERAFEAGRAPAALRKLRTRLTRLYAAHIATMAASFAILASCATRGLRLQEPVLYLWMNAPIEYGLRTLALLYAPHWYSLLPLYIVLAPFTVCAVYALRRWPGFTLIVAFLIWCIAQSPATDFAVMTRQEAWYFRPLAWQFMVILGAATAMYWDRVKSAAQSGLLQLFALGVVLSTFVLKTATLFEGARNQLFHLSPVLIRLLGHDSGKGRLAAFRLIHFLSLAILVIAFPWNVKKMREAPGVRLAAALGRDSLFIYCLILVLTIAENLFLATRTSGPLFQLFCSVISVAAITVIALVRQKPNAADYSRNSLENDQRRSGNH